MGILQPPLPCLFLVTIITLNKVLSGQRITGSVLLDRVALEDSKLDSVSISEERREEPTPIPTVWREMLPPRSSDSFHKRKLARILFGQLLPEFTHIHLRFERKSVPKLLSLLCIIIILNLKKQQCLQFPAWGWWWSFAHRPAVDVLPAPPSDFDLCTVTL